MQSASLFDEAMRYHPANRNVYQEIKDNMRQIVPFVGAGLSAFAYPLWPAALKKLAGFLTDRKMKSEICRPIKNGQLEEAAQRLEQARTPFNLERDIVALFSSDKLDSDKLKRESIELSEQAVSMLPELFQGPVVTTNFDAVLEQVYQNAGNPFDRVMEPGHPELLNQILNQGKRHGLYKIHGDASKGIIEYSSIVFTKTQYDTRYEKNSVLVRELRQCFASNIMLFLGCSLQTDRTVDLLKRVAEPGTLHYAIVDCARSCRDKRIAELGGHNIRAILYPKGRHELVRVILERLLEETDFRRYQSLPFHVGAAKPLPLKRFVYDAEITPLVGRASELSELKDFCTKSAGPVRWWAVTGPGGIGKSRLVYEFSRKMAREGWHTQTLKQVEYSDLKNISGNCTKPSLLIVDYVQAYAREIGQWLEALAGEIRDIPLRVLLVEREDQGEKGAPWYNMLFSDVIRKNEVKALRYRPEFLKLQPLGRESMLQIMRDYAKAENWELTEAKAGELYTDLQRIDEEFCRPLYALFITDAWGNRRNATDWHREDVLEYVLEREAKLSRRGMEQLLQSKSVPQSFLTGLDKLRFVATVWGDAELTTIRDVCPEIWADLERSAAKLDVAEFPGELLWRVGILSERDGREVPAIRPDLIGEYFVYTKIKTWDKAVVEQLLSQLWSRPVSTIIFIDRLMHDYANLLHADTKLWQTILPPAPPDGWGLEIKHIYARLHVNFIAYCGNMEICRSGADRLETLLNQYTGNAEIALALAQGLVNLSAKQDEAGRKTTIGRLEELSEEYVGNTEIALMLAQGLVNLSYDQDEAARKKTIGRLEELSKEYAGNAEIALRLAKGLFNLSVKQDEAGCKTTIGRLEELSKEYAGNAEIALELAKGLVNLSTEQDEAGRNKTIERLEELSKKYAGNAKIALELAKGLVNLSNRQDEAGCNTIIGRLEELSKEYAGNAEIALVLGSGLVNLSTEQDEAGRNKTIRRLEELSEEYAGNAEIALRLVQGLFNLSNKQDEAGCKTTIGRLEALSTEYESNAEIALELAKGLVNLSNKQDAAECQETIGRLEALSKEYAGNAEIALMVAKGLFNLSAKQDEARCKTTIGRLEELSKEYGGNAGIALELANGLFNLSNKQDEAGRKTTLGWLEELSKEYAGNAEIALVLAQGLVNLSNKQDEAECKTTLGRLEELSKEYAGNTKIALELTNGLFNLSTGQDEAGCKTTIGRLEELSKEYAGNAEIALVLAQGLVNLSAEQDEAGCKTTIERLEELTKDYAGNAEIALALAKGLFNLSVEQDEAGRMETVKRSEDLQQEYRDSPEIAACTVLCLMALAEKQEGKEAEKTLERMKKLRAAYAGNPKFDAILAMILDEAQ